MSFLVVTHKIRDYAQWKPMFDQSEGLRHEHGLRGGWILRDEKDKNLITVALEVDDLDAARRFMASDQLKEHMELGGVIGKPSILLLEEVERVPEPVGARKSKV
jgi:hypothetical protein